MKFIVLITSLLVALLGGVLRFFAGNSHYPRDPEQTLARVRHGTLRVGYTNADPWVMPGRQGPQGIEPTLVRAFAQQLGARVEWVVGTEEQLYGALKKHELDLLIAGITDESPWKTEVGLTRPYLRTALYVGVVASAPLTTTSQGQPVAVAVGTDLGHFVRERGGVPVYVPRLPVRQALVAGYDWQLHRWGYRFLGKPLTLENHVMAVPPGENAWLLALETYLYQHQAQLPQLLR